MAKTRPPDKKIEALRKQGSLNPHPDKVQDPLFAAADFFDARDLVQVKYEMVRRVHVDHEPVSQSASTFGFSRPTFYQARALLERGGLAALVPKKPGPRRAHKLSTEVVDFLQEERALDASSSSLELARRVQQRFGRKVHARSVERALARREKNGGDRFGRAADRPRPVRGGVRESAAPRARGHSHWQPLRTAPSPSRRAGCLGIALCDFHCRARAGRGSSAAWGSAQRVRRDPRQRRAGPGEHGLAWPGRDDFMSMEAQQKVSASHLKRSAYLYVRQSTMRQVLENTESTQRQYALRQRAVALGWPDERVIVIDTDLGQSGASAADREGFQKLVAEVGMGRAGIVLGLEVSRLARNSTDWHRLLEICALSNTLILDEDGVYDPAHFNDRLLLGLKGTISEAELHVLRARLHGGLLSKARRGELRCRLPIGFVYDEGGRVLLDPDKEVQESVRLFFQTFERTGAVHATIKYFREQGLLFPTRLTAGGKKGELLWGPLSLNRAAHALHNPWYAGAYVFGRGRWRKQPDGRIRHERLPQEEWHVLIRDAHPGYISWLEYERIEQRLLAAAKTIGFERAAGPPREGPALLQGRVVCGLLRQPHARALQHASEWRTRHELRVRGSHSAFR